MNLQPKQLQCFALPIELPELNVSLNFNFFYITFRKPPNQHKAALIWRYQESNLRIWRAKSVFYQLNYIPYLIFLLNNSLSKLLNISLSYNKYPKKDLNLYGITPTQFKCVVSSIPPLGFKLNITLLKKSMRIKDLHLYFLVMSQICFYYINPH